MKKGVFILVAFLGALGIGLFWLNGLINDRADDARTAGFAECEAEFAKKEVCLINSKLESVKNENIKKAVIYSKPNLNRDELLKLMYNNQL